VRVAAVAVAVCGLAAPARAAWMAGRVLTHDPATRLSLIARVAPGADARRHGAREGDALIAPVANRSGGPAGDAARDGGATGTGGA
jgi:hypothetical protein